jgi:hypothetical protein
LIAQLNIHTNLVLVGLYALWDIFSVPRVKKGIKKKEEKKNKKKRKEKIIIN